MRSLMESVRTRRVRFVRLTSLGVSCAASPACRILSGAAVAAEELQSRDWRTATAVTPSSSRRCRQLGCRAEAGPCQLHTKVRRRSLWLAGAECGSRCRRRTEVRRRQAIVTLPRFFYEFSWNVRCSVCEFALAPALQSSYQQAQALLRSYAGACLAYRVRS
jgi:hypothetical protein